MNADRPSEKKKHSWIPVIRNQTYDKDEAKERATEGTRLANHINFLQVSRPHRKGRGTPFAHEANARKGKRLKSLLLHDPGPALAGTITLEFPLHAKGFDGFLDVGFADAETRGAFPHRGGALLEKKEEHLVLDFAPRRPFCGEIALHLDRLGNERERNRDDDRAGRKIEGFLAIAFDDEGDAMAALLGERGKREDFEQGTVDRPAFSGVEILFRHVEREGAIGQNLDAVIEKEDRFGYFLYTFLDTARFDRTVDLGRIASPSFLLEKPREERGCKSQIAQGYRRCLGIPNPGSICFHRPEEGEEGLVFIGLVVSSEP